MPKDKVWWCHDEVWALWERYQRENARWPGIATLYVLEYVWRWAQGATAYMFPISSGSLCPGCHEGAMRAMYSGYDGEDVEGYYCDTCYTAWHEGYYDPDDYVVEEGDASDITQWGIWNFDERRRSP